MSRGEYSKRLRVCLLCGGRSSEHEVSLSSARCVLEAIDKSRYEIFPVRIERDGRWVLIEAGPDAPAGRIR